MTRIGLPTVLPEEPKLPIVCRRLHIERTLGEHLQCPYCFGTADDVKSRRHSLFCDFAPGVDPVSFGFPENLRRYR